MKKKVIVKVFMYVKINNILYKKFIKKIKQKREGL